MARANPTLSHRCLPGRDRRPGWEGAVGVREGGREGVRVLLEKGENEGGQTNA